MKQTCKILIQSQLDVVIRYIQILPPGCLVSLGGEGSDWIYDESPSTYTCVDMCTHNHTIKTQKQTRTHTHTLGPSTKIRTGLHSHPTACFCVHVC